MKWISIQPLLWWIELWIYKSTWELPDVIITQWFLNDQVFIDFVKEKKPQVEVIQTNSNFEIDRDFWNVDLVTALPLCTWLSQVTPNKKANEWKHLDHIRDIARLTMKINPNLFLFENAFQIAKKTGSQIHFDLHEILEGYNSNFYVENLSCFWVPQNRKRCVIFFNKNSNKVINTIPCFLSLDQYFWDKYKNTSKTIIKDIEKVFGYRYYKEGLVTREQLKKYKTVWKYVISTEKQQEYLDFLRERDIKEYKTFTYKVEKLSRWNCKIWDSSLKYNDDCMDTTITKNIISTLHYSEDRLYYLEEVCDLMWVDQEYMSYIKKHFGSNPVKLVQVINQNVNSFLIKNLYELYRDSQYVIDKKMVMQENTINSKKQIPLFNIF